jgi:hypothetical protein
VWAATSNRFEPLAPGVDSIRLANSPTLIEPRPTSTSAPTDSSCLQPDANSLTTISANL